MSGQSLDFVPDYKTTLKVEPDLEHQQHQQHVENLTVESISIINPVPPTSSIQPGPSANPDGKPTKKSRKKRVQITRREAARQAARERRRQGRQVINEKCACHLSCGEKISEEHRKVLNEKYWAMDLKEQKAFVKAHSEPGQVKRRRAPIDPLGGGAEVKKAFTYSFRLPNPEGLLLSVCCTFFLNTIGFRQGCGNTIYRTHMKDITQDKRGKYERDRTLHDAVWDDILSYAPRTYHKGSKYSATALYLPTQLNAKMMHAEFKQRQEAFGRKGGSGSYYCSVLREMDVHFVEMDDFEIPDRKPIPVMVKPKEEEPSVEHVPDVDGSAMVQQYEQCPPGPVHPYHHPSAVAPLHHPYQIEHKPAVVQHYTSIPPHLDVPQNYHIHVVKQEPSYYGAHMHSMPSHESHYAEHDDRDDYSESYSNMVEEHGYSVESSYHDTAGNVINPEEPKIEIIHEEYAACPDSYEESHDYESQGPSDQPPTMLSEPPEEPAQKVPSKQKRPKRPSEPLPAILPEGYPPVKRTKRFIARVSNKARRRQSHPVMQLDCNCIWNCKDKISLEQQEQINGQYWDMGYCDQRLFMLEHTERHSIKRRRAKAKEEGPARKGYTYSYKLTDSSGQYQSVCCQFFLNTLGFGIGSGNVIYRAHQVELSVAISDKRGKFARDRTLRNLVDDDILSHFSAEQQESGRLDLTATEWTPKKLYNVHVKRQAALGNDKPGSFAFYWRRTKDLKVMFAPRPEPKAGGSGASRKPRARPQKRPATQQHPEIIPQPGGGYLYVTGAPE
ncbi:uncharacterized protein LOC120412672 [Culex pipiens pallens]|uniref:uncharacterized protein LOC120412672 n=1 Tax=Culex pipiens pallens TaxID=42434 RepID=UPI001952FA79|nr:uncharacterized protein LOC120412672 [Culex pipiens pallens]